MSANTPRGDKSVKPLALWRRALGLLVAAIYMLERGEITMPADTPSKPKPAKLGAEKLTPEMQAAHDMVADAKAVVASAKLAARSARTRADEAAAEVKASKAKLAGTVGKLGAEKLTPEEQRRRFIETAREAGASEDEADFDVALKRIANPKAMKD